MKAKRKPLSTRLTRLERKHQTRDLCEAAGIRPDQELRELLQDLPVGTARKVLRRYGKPSHGADTVEDRMKELRGC